MRCDWCHKVKDDTERYLTVYGFQQFCPECLIKWNERKVRKNSGRMRYVMFKGRVYALEKDDVMEKVGTPEDLAYVIKCNTGQCTSITLKGVEIKNCKECEEYYDTFGKKSCNFIHDPTCEYDDRFCYGFEWREY